MTWEIFLGIVALVGFIISVTTPLIKLNSSITKLNAGVDTLQAALDRIEEENEKSHKRIWEHNEEQDVKLTNHENRIVKIETKMEIMHPESK